MCIKISDTLQCSEEFKSFFDRFRSSVAETVKGFVHTLDVDFSGYDPNNYTKSLKIVGKEGPFVQKVKPFKTQAHSHSLDGQMDEITVLKEIGNNSYLVDYRGVKCSAIFNPFNCTYYADDIYGRISNE